MRSVTTRNARKPNWLLRSIPPGMVVDAAWLTDAGYSTSLRSQYVAAGWLERPARGALRRARGRTHLGDGPRVPTAPDAQGAPRRRPQRPRTARLRTQPRSGSAHVGHRLQRRAAALLAPPAPGHAEVRGPHHRPRSSPPIDRTRRTTRPAPTTRSHPSTRPRATPCSFPYSRERGSNSSPTSPTASPSRWPTPSATAWGPSAPA